MAIFKEWPAICLALLVFGAAIGSQSKHAGAQSPTVDTPTADTATEGLSLKSGRVDDKTPQRLVALLNQSVLEGRYTTDSGGGNLKQERYTISSCKLGNAPELYDLQVRIQYGGKDVTVPITVRIVMADQTPVITLDQVWIPGMGTFDSRVLIRDRRYAGTWKHGDIGGHLFGRIEAIEPETEKPNE